MTLLEPPGSPGTFWFLKCLEKKPTFFPLVDAPPFAIDVNMVYIWVSVRTVERLVMTTSTKFPRSLLKTTRTDVLNLP